MKKLFTTILIILGFYGISSAQKDAGNFEFSIHAGLNGSYVTVTDGGYQNSGIKAGFNGGVSADYYFSDKWSLRIRASYDQKGWGNGTVTEYDDMGNAVETDGVNISANYITIPVLANLHLGSSKQWYVDFGPYVGFLMSANGGGTDLKPAFRSTDGGVDVGVGYKFPVSQNANFFIELESQAGVIDIDKGDTGFGSITNEKSSLNIGISF